MRLESLERLILSNMPSGQLGSRAQIVFDAISYYVYYVKSSTRDVMASQSSRGPKYRVIAESRRWGIASTNNDKAGLGTY